MLIHFGRLQHMKQYEDARLTSNVIQPRNKYWNQLIAQTMVLLEILC